QLYSFGAFLENCPIPNFILNKHVELVKSTLLLKQQEEKVEENEEKGKEVKLSTWNWSMNLLYSLTFDWFPLVIFDFFFFLSKYPDHDYIDFNITGILTFLNPKL